MSFILPTIPEPFMFNVLKHHKGSVQSFARHYSKNGLSEASAVLNINMSNLMMDFYTGSLGHESICNEIKENLISRNLYEQADFLHWVRQVNKKFRSAKISDGSTWILLLGRDKGRYLHVHPARDSRHALRFRSLAFKTAVLMLIAGVSPVANDFESQVNSLRTEFLGASPVGGIHSMKNIKRIFELLEE